MRSLENSSTRWQSTVESASSIADLKRLVRSHAGDNPCMSGFRSVFWKVFLLFNSTDVSTWAAVLASSRGVYTSLREHYMIHVEHLGELSTDPLNDDKNSPWNILRQDEALRAEIFQDVERCMPEEEYFRKPEAQRMLLDILFVFCKMNPDVGYRQGMHELLAPILWVVENDAVDDSQTAPPGLDSLMIETLNYSFIEHDSFTIFSSLMRSAKSFYELGDPGGRSNAFGLGNNQNGSSPIVDRSKRIHEVYLACLDPELASHLTAIEVLPQVFLIRWIRLLFGREFPFDSLLVLWDRLFAEDPALDLIDMICVAMLLRIRWQLLDADYSVALTLLLKYPSPEPPHGPSTFVEDAIYLRDNLDYAGGAKIITKYSGKAPITVPPTSRPETPSGRYLNPEQGVSRKRSSLPSPARFLQQQSGVEAILHGAAKGVLERGERLGINQVVRDAVGEMKKNMQGLSPGPSVSRRSSDVTRWSLDESRTVPSAKKAIASFEQRNKQLGHMLEDALDDLRKASLSDNNSTQMASEAIDIAIAKVQFVQVYLEDSTMPLPTEPYLNPSAAMSPLNTASEPLDPDQHSRKVLEEGVLPDQRAPGLMPPSKSSVRGSSETSVDCSGGGADDSDVNLPATLDVSTSSKEVSPEPSREGSTTPQRNQAPMPTRSSLAQSSFAWMLEPEKISAPTTKPAPPKLSSPFLGPGRRALIGTNREKAAFLFGDDTEGIDAKSRKPPVQSAEEEGFNLGTIKGAVA